MARSVYIYVAELDGEILAAFTVKHELRSWAKRLAHPSFVSFYRCKDNPCNVPGYEDPKPALMTLQEVLGD